MTQFETRSLSGALSTTEEGKLRGYAAVWNSPSHPLPDLGGAREIILPGAFSRSLREFPDVLAMVEHDKNRILGRTTAGTLALEEDDHGLRVEITPPDTSYARDVVELIRRGDMHSMSFRFRPYPNGATRTAGMQTLREVMLGEVSVVIQPAYPATEVALRAMAEDAEEEYRHALRRMRLAMAEA